MLSGYLKKAHPDIMRVNTHHSPSATWSWEYLYFFFFYLCRCIYCHFRTLCALIHNLAFFLKVSVNWYLGRALCDMWVSMDVLCCTASILHLVAIAFDRFWAVSNIDYVRRRCARQILLMIALVWFVSIAISIPPLFGWRGEMDNPELSGQCMISQDHGYTIFSTVGAFYCPLVLMLVLNFKIYRAARYRIRRKGFVAVGGGPGGGGGGDGGGGGGGGGGGRNSRRHHRGKVQVPMVYVEEITAQRTQRNSSGSDVSQDGYSLFNASCAHNEISRMDTGMDSGQDWNQSGYPGDSTTDGSGSNPENSYYPVPTEEEVACPDPPLPNSFSSNHLRVDTIIVPSRSLLECRPPTVNNHLSLECRPFLGDGRPCSDGGFGGDHREVSAQDVSLSVAFGERDCNNSSQDVGSVLLDVTNGSRRESCGSFANNGSANTMAGHDQDQGCVYNHEIPMTALDLPCIAIRKNSLDEELVGLKPRCVVLNSKGGGGGGGSGNQLTVPRGSGMPPTLGTQPNKSRANNNTKRAHNREKERHRREKLEMRRERKAARVLGIITGAFVVCWLPFFILALLSPFCTSACSIPLEVYSLFLWLGYVNSLLNPIIYTVFNPSFRCAFRKIFFRRLRSIGR